MNQPLAITFIVNFTRYASNTHLSGNTDFSHHVSLNHYY